MPVPTTGITFELERFVASDGRFEVAGRWEGVRGRRFVRPTLSATSGSHSVRLLATLEHKPWAPDSEADWTAVFPRSSEASAVQDWELAVAPDIAVRLPSPDEMPAKPRDLSLRAARPKDPPAPSGGRRPPASRARKGLPARDGGAGGTSALAEPPDRAGIDRATAARDGAREERAVALEQRDAARSDRDSAVAARDAAVAARDAAVVARDAAVADRDRAVERREAALRGRADAETDRDTAVRARESAIRERDEATRERDEAMAAWTRDRVAARAQDATVERLAVELSDARKRHEQVEAALARARAELGELRANADRPPGAPQPPGPAPPAPSAPVAGGGQARPRRPNAVALWRTRAIVIVTFIVAIAVLLLIIGSN